jgi:Uma2 family endonuclease
VVALAKRPMRMAVPEFLQWEPGDGFRCELVDGEPRARAPASTIHAFLQNELGSLIRNHLREHRPAARRWPIPAWSRTCCRPTMSGFLT